MKSAIILIRHYRHVPHTHAHIQTIVKLMQWSASVMIQQTATKIVIVVKIRGVCRINVRLENYSLATALVVLTRADQDTYERRPNKVLHLGFTHYNGFYDAKNRGIRFFSSF